MEIVIAGAGIGGLCTALFLHRDGHRVRIFESVPELKELGVGINLQPHAVRELDRLGLEAQLLTVGNPCVEWAVFNAFGQAIWSTPRGTEAGHDWPQISIHRGQLQGVLLKAVNERLGADAVATDHRLIGFDDQGDRVVARFATRNGGTFEISSDVLIGADGIHSTVRRTLYPEEGSPRYNGFTLWRGVARARPFLSGGTQTIAGRPGQKFIVYPITTPDPEGFQLTNWVCELDRPVMLAREDWNRAGRLEDFLPLYEDWTFDWLDVPDLIRRTDAIYEFSMVDRDPIPRWSFGRVTLLGDAAHPMVPIGANGASQAIGDAKAIANAIASHDDAVVALTAYDHERGPLTAKVVLFNRKFVLDEVIDVVHERAPNGFTTIESIISPSEFEDISRRYERSVTWARRGAPTNQHLQD